MSERLEKIAEVAATIPDLCDRLESYLDDALPSVDFAYERRKALKVAVRKLRGALKLWELER